MSRERLFADKKDIINAAIELLSDKGYESFLHEVLQRGLVYLP